MNKPVISPLVFFNASVILAGLSSPEGGSAKLLKYSKTGIIHGVISEIILDEATRRAGKVNLTAGYVQKNVFNIFKNILPPPKLTDVHKFSKIVKDPGDMHVLASAAEAKVQFLVSLDKKHILILTNKIKKYKICSPKELLENYIIPVGV